MQKNRYFFNSIVLYECCGLHWDHNEDINLVVAEEYTFEKLAKKKKHFMEFSDYQDTFASNRKQQIFSWKNLKN